MGITIGISSTVVMLALGRGVQDQIEQSFSRAGVSLLTVIPRTPPGASGSAQSYKLYWTDYEVLVAPGRIPHLLDAVPLASSMTDVLWQNRRLRGRLLGATAAYRQSAGLRLALGEFLSDEDDQSMRLVAVLGSRLASDLYTQGAYPLDTSLSVAGKRFRVIGVLAPTRTENGLSGHRSIPYDAKTSASGCIGQRITVWWTKSGFRVGDRDQVDDARRAIEEVLRPHRGVGPLDQDNFRVVTMEAGREAVQGIADSLTLFLAAIAGISLFCRRCRSNQHHARQPGRTHSRNRNPVCSRGDGQGHHGHVPLGKCHPLWDWRGHGDFPLCIRCRAHPGLVRHPSQTEHRHCGTGLGCQPDCGFAGGNLSGTSGTTPGSGPKHCAACDCSTASAEFECRSGVKRKSRPRMAGDSLLFQQHYACFGIHWGACPTRSGPARCGVRC